MLATAAKVGRFAGQHLAKLFMNPATGKMMDKAELVARFSPDVVFGALEALMTPGDVVDKAVAGLASAAGGSLGGIALSRLGGKNAALGLGLDMVGSIGGDMVGRAGGELIQRGKDKVFGTGQGLTAYERLSKKDREMLEEAIRQDETGKLLAQLGLLPASTQRNLYSDPSTGMGVA